LAVPALGVVGLAAAVLPAILVWTALAFTLAAAQNRLTTDHEPEVNRDGLALSNEAEAHRRSA
jgi:hypothetical protein